jgi:hypothetical protein
MLITSFFKKQSTPVRSEKGAQTTGAPRPSAHTRDTWLADPDAVAARAASQRLERLIGLPRNATLPFLQEAAAKLPTSADRRAWLEAALHDHDLRASHVDAVTARMMIARLTLSGIERQMNKPESKAFLGRIQALQAAHDIAERAFAAVVEPETRALAQFANEAQRLIETPAASLALIQDGLRLLEHVPEDSPVDVSASIATLALGHMDRKGRTQAETEAIGLAALRAITELRGTPLLQTRLQEVEREPQGNRRLSLIREALGAEA